jgi:aspartyl-tRNA(Asn)/glutamyl-tRNA(Gln) amidotransferase subunit A
MMTIPPNLAGLPSISVPVSLSQESQLPIGLQLIGRALDDEQLLHCARVLERCNPFALPKENVDYRAMQKQHASASK